MTWIRTRTPEDDPVVRETFEALGRLYPGEYGPGYRPARPVPDAVANDSIMRSHSLIPEAMFHAFATYGVLLASDLPLTRRQHEMIATTVSALNRCVF